jgi:hypothetical protein
MIPTSPEEWFRQAWQMMLGYFYIENIMLLLLGVPIAVSCLLFVLATIFDEKE